MKRVADTIAMKLMKRLSAIVGSARCAADSPEVVLVELLVLGAAVLASETILVIVGRPCQVLTWSSVISAYWQQLLSARRNEVKCCHGSQASLVHTGNNYCRQGKQSM